MTRDYTQPHPDAIFKDKPRGFIECFKHIDDGIKQYQFYIDDEEYFHPKNCGSQVVAIFIVKPKKNKLTLHKAEQVDLSNAKFIIS